MADMMCSPRCNFKITLIVVMAHLVSELSDLDVNGFQGQRPDGSLGVKPL